MKYTINTPFLSLGKNSYFYSYYTFPLKIEPNLSPTSNTHKQHFKNNIAATSLFREIRLGKIFSCSNQLVTVRDIIYMLLTSSEKWQHIGQLVISFSFIITNWTAHLEIKQIINNFYNLSQFKFCSPCMWPNALDKIQNKYMCILFEN